jgi:hypothetical protein
MMGATAEPPDSTSLRNDDCAGDRSDIAKAEDAVMPNLFSPAWLEFWSEPSQAQIHTGD